MLEIVKAKGKQYGGGIETKKRNTIFFIFIFYIINLNGETNTMRLSYQVFNVFIRMLHMDWKKGAQW